MPKAIIQKKIRFGLKMVAIKKLHKYVKYSRVEAP